MEKLKEIIEQVQKACKELNFVVSTEAILNNAVKIYLSDKIQEHKEKNMETMKKSQEEPITSKQKWLLQKAVDSGYYTGNLDNLTKREASVLISELKAKYGQP